MTGRGLSFILPTMKQVLYIFLVWFALPSIILAQNKYDYNWVFANLHLGGNHLSFDGDSLNISALGTTDGRSREALACMSDKEGNLLFYTNNCTVFNKNHQRMENGEGLNPGVIQTYWCSVNPFANPYNQSIISIPKPEKDSAYLIFHIDSEIYNFGGPGGSFVAPKHLLMTEVDMNANNGLGKVVSKNSIVIEDTLAGVKLSAVRHANGRDWWLIIPEYKSNCYYSVLVTPYGNVVGNKQCLGYIWNKYDESGGALFTNNGNKFIRSNDMNGLNVFDFDRCDGSLTNTKYISVAPDTNTISGLILSASGRFAYYNTRQKIYQFDLESQNILASKTLVAQYDGFTNFGTKTDFYYSKLASDGKIYMCTFDPTYYLHVIEHPDSAGLACEVRQHAIELPNRHFAAMPNYPNYRLGALAGSLCDTISVNTYEPYFQESQIIVYPNPSSGDITIQHKGGSIIVKTEMLHLVGGAIFIDTQQGNTVKIQRPTNNFKPGFYLLKITDDTGLSEVKKIIIK